MEFKVENKVNYFAVICILVALFFAIGYVFIMGVQSPQQEAAVLKNWHSIDDSGGENEVSLPKKVKSNPNSQEVIHTVLPDSFSEAMVLAFWTDYQEVDVVLGEEVIYSTRDFPKMGKAVAPRWNYIDLPFESAGEDIYFCYRSDLEKYNYRINEIFYGTYEELSHTISSAYALNRILDLFIMFIGLLHIVFGLITKGESWQKQRQIIFGGVVLLLGIWLQTDKSGYNGVLIGDYGNVFLSYFSLFLLPEIRLLYVNVRSRSISALTRVNDILILLFAIELPLTLFAQTIGLMNLVECRTLGWINLSIAALWGEFIFVVHSIQKRDRDRILSAVNGGLFAITVLLVWISKTHAYGMGLGFDEIARVCVIAVLLSETIQLLWFLEQENEQKKTVLQQNKSLRIQALNNQIRPHFILNTLGAIRSMIRLNPEYAEEQLYEFSKYIRKNIEDRDYSKVVPFFEEMDYINTYVNLEKLRFHDRIKIVKELSYTDFMILPLTIQPLVENAIKHGLLGRIEGGTVWIRSFKENNQICIEIEDDGDGFNAADIWANIDNIKSVGLRSALYRLTQEMDGKCYVYSLESGRIGTKIRIELPGKWGTEDENNHC